MDQEPQKLKTKSLDVVLNRLSPRSRTKETIIDDGDMGFKLPFTVITDERAGDAKFIDAVVSRRACMVKVLLRTDEPYYYFHDLSLKFKIYF